MSQENSHHLRKQTFSVLWKLGAALLSGMVLSLVTRKVLALFFSPSELGPLYYAENLVKLWFPILPLGIGNYISREIPARPEHARDIFPTIVLFQSLFSLGMAAVIWYVFSVLLNAPGREDALDGQQMLFLLMCLYGALFTFRTEIFNRLMLSLHEPGVTSRANIISSLGLFLGTTVLLLAQMQNISWGHLFEGLLKGQGYNDAFPAESRKGVLTTVAVSYALSEVLGISMLLHRSKSWKLFSHFRMNKNLLRTMLLVGLPFFMSTLLLKTFSSLDTILLERLANTTELGLYGASQRLFNSFLLLLPIVYGVMPILSKTLKNSPEQGLTYFQGILRAVALLSFPLSLALIVFPDVGTLILYKTDFLPMGRSLAWFGPQVPLTYMATMTGMYINLRTDGKQMLVSTLIAIVLNAALCFTLIPLFQGQWGLGGAGAGASASTLCAEAFMLAASIRVCPDRLIDGKTLRTLIFSFLPCIPLLYAWDGLMALPLWVRVAGFTLGLPTWMLLTGMANSKDLNSLKNLLRRNRNQQEIS